MGLGLSLRVLRRAVGGRAEPTGHAAARRLAAEKGCKSRLIGSNTSIHLFPKKHFHVFEPLPSRAGVLGELMRLQLCVGGSRGESRGAGGGPQGRRGVEGRPRPVLRWRHVGVVLHTWNGRLRTSLCSCILSTVSLITSSVALSSTGGTFKDFNYGQNGP